MGLWDRLQNRLTRRSASVVIDLPPESYTHYTIITRPGDKVVLEVSFTDEAEVLITDPLSFYAWLDGRPLRPHCYWRGASFRADWLPPQPGQWVLVVRPGVPAHGVQGQIRSQLEK